MTQDSLCTYGDVWIMKEALEMAGKADRRAVSEAIHKIDTTDGPAKYFPGGRVKFLENGRRDGALFVIAQWQDGEPITVYPPLRSDAERCGLRPEEVAPALRVFLGFAVQEASRSPYRRSFGIFPRR